MAKKKKKHRRSVALAARSHRAPARRHSRPKRHHRRRKGGAGVSWVQALAAGAVLGYVAENVPQVTQMVSKVPGAKTFGVPATIGVLALAADKYVHHNKWLKIVGIGGILVGAYQLGQKKFDVKWVGDTNMGDYDYSQIGDADDGMIGDSD
jgi:hypothetical protein